MKATWVNWRINHISRSAQKHSGRGSCLWIHLRGMEGDAARVYFGVFDHLIVNKGNGFSFNGRNRRPPLDPVNCLLSFVYTLLLHDVRSALESVGLDSAVGLSSSGSAGAARTGPGHDGGVPAGDRRPAGAVADQPGSGPQKGFYRNPGNRCRAHERRSAQEPF
jgi:hypothetical protein